MASADEIAAKAAEFAEAHAAYLTAQQEYDAALAPYLEKKQVLADAVLRLDVLDKEFEQLTTEYQAPTPPEPK